MARFLAIDWDETECRYAAATLHNEKVVLREVGIVPIEEEEDGVESSPLVTLSMAVHHFCKEEKIGSCPLLISLGRNDVEWLPQKLPPSKESEIPLLLKNQVLREIPGSIEADPVDYLILETSPEGHRILTLTISQTFQKTLTRTFRSLGYPPQRIGFRAANAAELVLQNAALLDGEPSEPRLIVNLVGNDADLIIVTEGRITAIRSFRLPLEHQQKNLAEEIERTLTIGWEETEPVTIKRVILFGNETETKLAGYLTQNGLDVQFLNPFTLPNVSAPKISALKSGSEPEKFASLIGSLLVQSQKNKPVIDFLHPKEAPKPPNYTRPALLTLILLAIVGVGLYFWNQGVIRSMEKQLADIKEEHKKVAGKIQELQPSYQTLWYTLDWELRNVLWLNVLKDLSTILPGNTDLVVDQMTFTTGAVNNVPRSTGSIMLTGMVRDTSVLIKLQNDLNSSGRYYMLYPAPTPNPASGGSGGYPWLFRTTIYRLG